MHDQTPVQIAWVTRDLDVTEKALTALMGAKKWVRMPDVHFGPQSCTHRGRPADYVDFLDAAGPGLHHVCMEAADVDGYEAMLRDAQRAGTPAEIRAFFDYVKGEQS
jgi:Glyoxalase/Bleomycin resistance protein/Dioxygenase superfamily